MREIVRRFRQHDLGVARDLDFLRSVPTAPTDTRPPKRQSPRFDLVLRGYDRVEVDVYVRGLLEENAALRRDLVDLQTAHNSATTPGETEARAEYLEVVAMRG